MYTNLSVQFNELSQAEHTHVTSTEIKNKTPLAIQSHNHALYTQETPPHTSNSTD